MIMSTVSREQDAPAVAEPQEFAFSYRCGATECRIVVRTRDDHHVSSFIVFEPNSQSVAHMAVAIAHGTADWVSAATAVADDLLTEIFAHTGPKQLPPDDAERERLRAELAHWVWETRPQLLRAARI